MGKFFKDLFIKIAIIFREKFFILFDVFSFFQ